MGDMEGIVVGVGSAITTMVIVGVTEGVIVFIGATIVPTEIKNTEIIERM
jgi:hypothetical protein